MQRSLNSFKKRGKAHRCGSPPSFQGELVHKASLGAHCRAGHALLGPVVSLAHLSSPGISSAKPTLPLSGDSRSPGGQAFTGQGTFPEPVSARCSRLCLQSLPGFRAALTTADPAARVQRERGFPAPNRAGRQTTSRERDCCARSELDGKIVVQPVRHMGSTRSQRSANPLRPQRSTHQLLQAQTSRGSQRGPSG